MSVLFPLPNRGNFFIFRFLFFLFILILNLAPLRGSAQGSFNLKNKRNQIHLSFGFSRNLIVIPIMINNQGPYHFIFDTGISILLITNPELPKTLGLSPNSSILIKGFGNGQGVNAQIINSLTLKIGNISGMGFSAAVLPPDILEFSNYVGVPIDGIIGYDLVKDFRIEINFDNTSLSFENPNFPFNSRGYITIPLIIQDTQAFVEGVASLDGEVYPLKLVLDTGGGNSVFLDSYSLKSFKIPSGSPKSSLGWGINGVIEGTLFRLQFLNLNGLKINQVICAFPDYPDSLINTRLLSGNGNLGTEILRRFTVVLDYSHKKLYLKKHASFDAPYDYDMSGISLTALGDTYQRFVISSIDPKSPGERAGLKEGDLILKINDITSADYSLGELDLLFKSGNGKKISLGIYREGNYIETVITLKKRV